MASVRQVREIAEEAGWTRTECVHPGPGHIVFDYPRALGNGTIGSFWRVHINTAKVPHVTHIEGTDTPTQSVSLNNAIDFIKRVSRQHPKEG